MFLVDKETSLTPEKSGLILAAREFMDTFPNIILDVSLKKMCFKMHTSVK